MKFMSDTSLSELVAKIKSGFLPVKTVSTDTGEATADLDEYKTNGIYVITGDGADVKPGNANHGYLVVLKYSSVNTAQLWIDRDPDSWYSDYPIFCRQYNSVSGGWGSWVQFPSVRDWDTLRTSISNKLDSSDFTLSNITGTLPIDKGGTGATTASGALSNLGIVTTEYTPTAMNDSALSCKVYKTLDRVYLEGYISVLPTSTSAHQIRAANLPEACRPTTNSRGLAYIKGSDNAVSPIALEVTTTGNMIFTGIVGVQSGSSFSRQTVYFSTSYHVDN